MLRLLWLVPVPLDLSGMRDQSGGWLDTLAHQLLATENVEITALSPGRSSAGVPGRSGHSRIVFGASIPGEGRSIWSRFLPSKVQRLMDAYDRSCVPIEKLVDTGRFDLVHIHGTEASWLRDAAAIAKPKVVSIHGVLSDCASGFWSKLPLQERLRSPLLMTRWIDMRSRAKTERAHLPQYGQFFCRTNYSERFVKKFSPNAMVHFDGRILRPPFYSAETWRPHGRQNWHVITTVSEQPYKGVHHLLPTLLEPSLRKLTLHIVGIRPGSEYGQVLTRISRRLGLCDRIRFLGRLPAEELRSILLQMDAYVHPATQENSPNALAEAMSLGLPCAVSRAGGSLEQIREGVSGVSFDPLDVNETCYAIERLCRDRTLAERLSGAAVVEARERHDPNKVLAQTMEGYLKVISRG